MNQSIDSERADGCETSTNVLIPCTPFFVVVFIENGSPSAKEAIGIEMEMEMEMKMEMEKKDEVWRRRDGMHTRSFSY